MNKKALKGLKLFIERDLCEEELIDEWKVLWNYDLITTHCGAMLAFLSPDAQKRVYTLSRNRRMTDSTAEKLKHRADKDYNISNGEIIRVLADVPFIDDEMTALKRSMLTDKNKTEIEIGVSVRNLSLYDLITNGKLNI